MRELIRQRIAAVEEAMRAAQAVFERHGLCNDSAAVLMLAAFLAAVAGDGNHARATRTLAEVIEMVSTLARTYADHSGGRA